MYNETIQIVNELLRPDSVHQESPPPTLSTETEISLPPYNQCDAGTQVRIVPEKKSARVQTQVRTRTIGE